MRAIAAVGRCSPAALGCPRASPRQARRLSAAASVDPPAQSSSTSASTSGRAETLGEGGPSARREPHPGSLLSPSLLRRASAASDANEVLDLLVEELGSTAALCERDALDLLLAALDRDNVALAQSVYRAMKAATPGGSVASVDGATPHWPAASVDTSAALVVGLARALQTREAIEIINALRSRGLPTAEDIGFGSLVACPADPQRPLAVVQPQEGVKPVADAVTRYEYELYSGTVASCSSESLVTERSWLRAAVQRVGLVRRPATSAVHTLAVQTPAGKQRTFRVGTETADVPAKTGDRVTVVCAPETPVFSRRRLLSSAPPGTKPGEALSMTNHTTQTSTRLLRPPAPGGQDIPGWWLPVAVVLAGSDAASSLVDPALPYLLAGGLAAVIATATRPRRGNPGHAAAPAGPARCAGGTHHRVGVWVCG